MSLIAKSTGTNYRPAPAGTHTAICISVIDIGTQVTPFKDDKTGQPKSAHQIRLGFELPNEPMEDGRPFTISKYYTCSLHEKATLRQHLESWRGRVFNEEELDGFHLKNILGKACLLSITHEMGNDKSIKAKIGGIMALPKGSQVPTQSNPSIMFDIDSWNQDTFDALGDHMKKQIMASEEAKARAGATTSNGHAGSNDLPEDDIPF